MGGRRKRANSDNDESLELGYRRDQGSKREEDGEHDSKKETKREQQVPSKSTKTDDSPSKKSKSNEEQERIEKLRLKKKRRKELKKSKAQERDKKQSSSSPKSPTTTSSKKKPATSANKDSNIAFTELKKGVQYRDVIVGKGPIVEDRKKIRVAYVLRAKQQYGKILDTSNDFRFRVGRGEVIKGWDIGVLGMRQGGKRLLLVPHQAGYGGRDVGAGKYGMLFFEVTVLDC